MNTERIKALKIELRELKKEMRARGVRRVSFMNGGLTSDEKYFNAEIFRINSEIIRLEKEDKG